MPRTIVWPDDILTTLDLWEQEIQVSGLRYRRAMLKNTIEAHYGVTLNPDLKVAI